jgi:hypothetical protein
MAVKRFLLHFAAFLLLLLGILGTITWLTDMRLRGWNKGRMRVWNEVASGKVNADVLVLGGSNAHVAVNPQILDSVLVPEKAYNMGLEGYGFDMQVARYRFYRQHNKPPGIILLCVNYFEFERSLWNIDRGQFLPYCYDTSIRAALYELGVSRIKLSIPIFKYLGEANLVTAALLGQAPLPQDEPRLTVAGYLPALQHWNQAEFRRNSLKPELFRPRADSAVFNSFLHFLDECKAEGIAAYVVFTPHNHHYIALARGSTEYRQWLKAAVADRAPFIDVSELPLWKDTGLFYNGTHLNSRGADLFTSMIADSLRAYGIRGK